MKFDGTYCTAKFKDRPNRFLAKVELMSTNPPNKIIEAHVPDPGRLKELFLPEALVILRRSYKRGRKTQYSLIAVKIGDIWVNIDSQLTNRLFKEEFTNIPRFQRYEIIQSEYTFGNSRLDFLMRDTDNDQKALIEVKSVTLVKKGVALFPDAPTKRGVKHVKELIKAIKKGYQSFIVFIIKRNDAFSFKPNVEIDPEFSNTLVSSLQYGVQVCAVKCHYDPIKTKELRILGEVRLDLNI